MKLNSLMAGILTSGSLALAHVLLYNPIALAQIGVSPLVIQETAQNGKAQGIISIRNTTNAPTRVRIYTEPFTYDQEKGFQTIETHDNDLSPYLRFSPMEMVIPPGSERRVRLLAQLLPSLPDGEYRTAVFSESLQETQDSQQNTVGIVARIGVTVYVRKGAIQPNLTVQNTTFDKNNNRINLLVNNSGKATALPKVVWTITQNGTSILNGETPETTVLAQSDRFLNISLLEKNKETGEEKPVSLKTGNYQVKGQLIWQEGTNNPNIIPFETTVSILQE